MYADEGWLLEALINVISNCYEHINQKKDGMVYIDISSNSEVCMITISDNGDGIQDCDIAGIFDRFMSRKSQDEFHAGIGLNLSKLIIEAHHGNIRAGNSDKYGGAQYINLRANCKLYVSRAIYNTVIAINNKCTTVSNQTGSSTLSSDEVQRTSLITKDKEV